MSGMQPLNDHERIRRELWAAVYRQAHDQSAQRVRPQFCFTEDADKAVADFDRRFGTPKEYHPDFSGLPSCPGSAAPGGVKASDVEGLG